MMFFNIVHLFIFVHVAFAVTYEYTTYKNGKLIKVEAKDKRKYASSVSNDNVLYIQSAGLIVERQDAKGKPPLETFKDLCSKKNDVGCYVMAQYYADLGDLSKAVGYFDQACELGDVQSCMLGGSHYQQRLKDFAKARDAFKYACEKRDPAGCFNLGHAYRELGDEAAAMHSFSLACQMGFEKACIERAYTLKEKSKGAGDLQESLKIFTGYCSKGDQTSCAQAKEVSRLLRSSK